MGSTPFLASPSSDTKGILTVMGIVLGNGSGALLDGLAQAISEVGSDQFGGRLAHLIELASAYESAVFIWYDVSRGASPLFSNLSSVDERITLDPYLEGAYLLDPWYNMILDGAADGVYRLCDCAPDDFAESDYYKEYYANVGLEGEIALFVRLTATTFIVLSAGTRQGRETLDGGLAALASLFPCIRALCVRHWQDDIPLPAAPPRSIAQMCLESGLSGREIEVTNLLLRGYSNKVIARDLSISPETVKVYRKRINKKLGTSSAREVFARFFPTRRIDSPALVLA